MDDERYLTTAEAARRLGVKPQTVYAYVSRGLLTSVRRGRGGSLIPLRQVDRLAGRPAAGSAGAIEQIRTELTLLDGDDLWYRGHRAAELATRSPFEAVAGLLWTGELAPVCCDAAPERVAAARAAVAALPATARLADRLHVAVAVAGAADPLRSDLSPRAVTSAAGPLLGLLVDVLSPEPAGTTLADRLWPALTDRPPQPDTLNAALVLLADHGLAVSTIAARVAASARAHPYSVVAAGMAALDGHYHGAASTLAYRFLAEAMADPVGALADRLRAGQPVPGFGHRVYRAADPRAAVLLGMLPAGPVTDTVAALADRLAERSGLFPNVDLALAATMHAYGMRPDAGEAVFAIARTAGWLGHALEEYAEPGLRFRALGVYTARRGTGG
jgi:citrate synthase